MSLKNGFMINSLIRSIATLVVGIMLISMRDSAMELLIRIMGIAFFLPALVSMVNIYISRHETSRIPAILITVVDLGSIAFGIWLMIFPATFQVMFVKLMAILLFLVALHQLFVIISSRRTVKISWAMVIAPLVMAVISLLVVAEVIEAGASALSLVLGICAVISGLSDIIITLMIKRSAQLGISSSASTSGGGAVIKKQ